jgi:hypothetical protein
MISRSDAIGILEKKKRKKKEKTPPKHGNSQMVTFDLFC